MMSDIELKNSMSEPTAVDDVRRIRERLDRESEGDIYKHIERSNRTLEEYRVKLGLKVVKPPSNRTRRDDTGD
jgi:hypothetical protein